MYHFFVIPSSLFSVMSSCSVLHCHVNIPCHMLSCHHAMPCIVMSLCSVMNCDVIIIPWPVLSYNVMSCFVFCHAIIPCHLVSCHHTMSGNVMPLCQVMYCHVIRPCHDPGSTRVWGTTTPGAQAPRCTMMCRCSSAKCSPPQPSGRRLELSHHNDCSHALGLKYTFTCLSTAWPKIQNRDRMTSMLPHTC